MRRKKYFPLAAIALLVIALFVAGDVAGDEHKHGDKDKAKAVTVEGLLVDTKCYGMNPVNWKADHITPKGEMSQCAQACANMGIPVGVLKGGQEGGDVYILVTPAPQLSDYMAKTVKVTGMSPYKGAIIPEKFFVKGEKGEWKEVKIGMMM